MNLLVLYKYIFVQYRFQLEADRCHFFETDTDIFKKIFTDIWPAADIRLATHTDIPKLAYRCFNKVLWLKLVRIAYSPDLRQAN